MPRDLAFSECADLPVSIIRIASVPSIRSGRRKVPPRPGCSPRLTSGKPNSAPSMARMRSQASAISNPAPSAAPWTTATVGQASRSSRSRTAWPARRRSAASSGSVISDSIPISAPAANPAVFAERITSPRGGSRSIRSSCSESPRSASSVIALTSCPGTSSSSQATPSPPRAARQPFSGGASRAGPRSRRVRPR